MGHQQQEEAKEEEEEEEEGEEIGQSNWNAARQRLPARNEAVKEPVIERNSRAGHEIK